MSQIRSLLAYTDGDQWRLGIGDPTLMGWVTVLAYFVTAVICLKVAMSEAKREGKWRSREPLFWVLIFCAMLLLGINKQLDLQTWLTLTVRKISRNQGWYEYRRPVQVLFILFLIICSGVACRFIFALGRKKLRQNGFALMGIIFVACFVIARAASFHHVDLFLKSEVAGVRMNWVLELLGIGLILMNALWRWKMEPPASRTQVAEGSGGGKILTRRLPEQSKIF
jgi:hypothetical protein